MIKSFEHQTPFGGAQVPRPEPKPQHGQQPDAACLKVTQKRAFEPRPGH